MIAVCYIEAVADSRLPVEIDESGADIKGDGMIFGFSAEDRCAVEETRRIGERTGSQTVALALGGSEVVPILRGALAIGAQRAIRVCHSGWSLGPETERYRQDTQVGRDTCRTGPDSIVDVRGRATIVAAALRAIGYELILAGSRGNDGGPAELPAYVSAVLGLPQVSNVTRLEVGSDRDVLVAWRKLERGWLEKVECAVPALLTVEAGINQVPYPSLPAQLSAWQQPIEVLDVAALGLGREMVEPHTKVTAVTPPRPRTKKTFIPDADLSLEERLDFIIGGQQAQKRGRVVVGSPSQLAAEFLNYLKREKIATK